MDSVWSNSGEPDACHFFIALFFAVSFVVVRFCLDRFVFRRLALWLTNGAALMKIKKDTYAKVAKCSESMWKLTYYATVEAWILIIAYHEPWFRDTHYYFKGWPNQELKLPLKLFYMCQCGFYTYSIVALVVWETRRKDFSVMMSHHIITVFLIGYSYLARFIYGGSIVLALHDASDVFLEAAKIFKYSERDLGASMCFGLFALSWLVLRLIFFPFWVIRATSCISPEYVDLSQAYGTSLYYIINTMLLMLLMFHIYWWFLISSMIMRQLKNRGTVGEDIRSDSEDDD